MKSNSIYKYIMNRGQEDLYVSNYRLKKKKDLKKEVPGGWACPPWLKNSMVFEKKAMWNMQGCRSPEGLRQHWLQKSMVLIRKINKIQPQKAQGHPGSKFEDFHKKAMKI